MNRRPGRLLALLLVSAACGGDRANPASHQRDSGRAAADSASAADSLPLTARTEAEIQPALADTPRVETSRPGRPAPTTSTVAGVGGGSPAAPGPDSVPPVTETSAAPLAAPPSAAAGGEAPPASAPATSPPPASPAVEPPATARRVVPRRAFAVGETLNYEVRFGRLRVGSASMELRGVEEIRGEPAFHAVFRVQGGNALYRVDDHYESWFSTATLASLRYEQNIDQGSYERLRRFEIYPERRVFREAGKPADEPSVSAPLDDASFLYFLRSVPLEVGRTYHFDRYFRPDRNPVTVRVLRRERVRVPAGEFDAIVVQPSIKTKGIFSEGGQAEVWFADDSSRRILQIRSRLRFGSLNLYLR